MDRIYKYIAFGTIAVAINALSCYLQSSFIDNFIDNIIGLLATLLAINIASSALITQSIKEQMDASGHLFTKSRKALRTSIIEQIILLCISFVVLVVKKTEWDSYSELSYYVVFTCNSIILLIFIIFLEIIWDLGQALISVITYNPGDDKE